MCSQAHGALIAQTYKLHYLFGLKGDQPTLYTEAQRLLGRRRAPQAQTVDVVGKCTVTRQLYLTQELAGYLDWTHLQTVVRVHTQKHDISSGTLVVLLLRRIAHNLLALFRSVTQRSEDKRQMPWNDLLRWVYNTFIAATASDLQGLRRRQLPAASVA